VAERIHRDTRGEIQVAIAIGGDEKGAFPALEADRKSVV